MQNNQNNNIDVNVYMMALRSGNPVGFLQNVQSKAPYVQNELSILTAPQEQQQQFINEVCKKLNMTQDQFFNCCNQLLKNGFK